MFTGAPRRTALRRSRKAAAFAALLAAVAFFLGYGYFGAWMLLAVFPTSAVVVLCVFLHRYRSLRGGLPEPYGRGRVSVVGVERVSTQGIVVISLGVALVFVPFIALFLLPSALVVGCLLGLMGGLTSSEVLSFFWLARFETNARSRVFSVTEFREVGGHQQLLKSLEMESEEGAGESWEPP